MDILLPITVIQRVRDLSLFVPAPGWSFPLRLASLILP